MGVSRGGGFGLVIDSAGGGEGEWNAGNLQFVLAEKLHLSRRLGEGRGRRETFFSYFRSKSHSPLLYRSRILGLKTLKTVGIG
jgi:hypothetical protein